MSLMPKKYCINDLIEVECTRTGMSKGSICEELAKHIRISTRRLRSLRNARIGSSVSLTTDQLVAASEFFNVQVDDLINKNGYVSSEA